MAKRAKDRPYHCQLCDRRLAEDELGLVCSHFAHGTMTTFVADRSANKPIPDTPCTACDMAMRQKKKNAEKAADVHVICSPCYRGLVARNIGYFTDADRAQGYVLVPRAHYDKLAPRKRPLSLGRLTVGRVFKLGFSPIPSTSPISLERMWVRLTCVLPRGELHGAIANDPQLFKRKVLKEGDTVVFRAAHVHEEEKRPSRAPKRTKR